MPHLSVSLLGPFAVSLDGEPITGFSYDKVRALLAYLLMESTYPHRRQHLAGLLWPDYPEARARQSLSQALWTLRIALQDRPNGEPRSADHATGGRSFIETGRRSVAFAGDCNCNMDVDEFLSHIAAVRAHPHAALSHCDPCLEHLETAVHLYRGDFLTDLTINDSAAFEEWTLLQRERLQRRMLEALDQLTESHLARGTTAAALRYGRQQIEMDPWRESAHQQVMHALALDGRRAAALAQYEACRRTLFTDLGVEPAAATQALYERIRDGEFESPLGSTTPGVLAPTPGEPPFKGLRFFDVEDAGIFFGRESLTERLVARLHAGERFLAIVGASGSGKSSLVRAGLVARLQHPTRATRERWDIRIITPTMDPMESLAGELAGAPADISRGGIDAATLAGALLSDRHALHRFAQQIMADRRSERRSADRRLLIVVDQFEELFTLCHTPAHQQAFIDNLLAAATQSGPTSVVLALRADLYHHCAQYEELRQALESHQVYIGAMTYPELTRAIERPAQASGWSFEPGLVALLLKDAGASPNRPPEPGALPLLSQALLETWRRRRGRTLTTAGYAEAGGVQGAIAQTAESTYRTLTPNEQAIARSIFLRLTELGHGEEGQGAIYSRRRAPLTEIIPEPTQHSDADTVLGILIKARLITAEKDCLAVAHEALIREWPMLREWIEEDVEGLRIHRHLTEAAEAWVASERDAGDLYRGARLAQAEAWAVVSSHMLNPLEQEFLTMSSAAVRRDAAEREARQRRELAAAQQFAQVEQKRSRERGRLLRWLALAAVLMLVATLIAVMLGRGYRRASQDNAALAAAADTAAAENASIAATAQVAEALAVTAREEEAVQRTNAELARQEAGRQRDAALEQSRINLANSLVGQAAMYQEKNSELALLLAVEGNAVDDTATTQGAILSALEHSPGRVQYFSGHTSALNDIAVSRNGSRLASASGDEIRLWDTGTGDPIGDPLTGFDGVVQSLTVTPDGGWLAALIRSTDETTAPKVAFWRLSNGGMAKEPTAILTSTHFHGGIEAYMALGPDGRTLTLAGCQEIYTVPSGYAFCAQGGATHWDIAGLLDGSGDATEVAFVTFPGEAWEVASSPVDGLVALGGCTTYDDAACEEGFTALWRPETGEFLGPQQGAFTDTLMTLVRALAFTPDGRRLAAGGCSAVDSSGVCVEGHVDFWDLRTSQVVTALTVAGEEGVLDVAAHPTGDTLAVGSADKIRLWNPLTDRLEGQPMVGHTGNVSRLAFTPDGETLFSAGQDTKIGRWDLSLRGGVGNPIVLLPMPLFHVTYSPDGTTIAAGTYDAIAAWNSATGEPVEGFPLLGHEGPVWDVAFSPDGKVLASAGMNDGTVRLWDVATRSSLGAPVTPAPGQSVYGVRFSPDSTTLATSGDSADIVLWDAASVAAGIPLSRTLVGHEHGGIPQVVFSPDGTLLASAGHDNTARLWDVDTGQQRGSGLVQHTDNVLAVAFSPDGRLLASGGQDTTICLWNVATGALVGQLAGHNQFVWRLVFTPDGERLVSVDAYGILRLWDMRDRDHLGRPIGATLPGHQAWAWGLAVSPDGTTAVTTARSGELQQWQIDPRWWREHACAIAGRSLTQDEWEQFLPGRAYHATCP
ncbi:MAG: hypothetical protein MUQ10_12765 [Anaerolineae bacterium]|nr:hypothetical protein [Anaerolineae bacterium]